MRSDVERYLAGRPVQAPIPPAVPAAESSYPTAATAVVPTTAPEEEDEGSRGRTGMLIALGLLLVVLIAGAAYLMPRLFESAPDTVGTPNVIGKTENAARTAIGDAGLAVGTIDRENSADVPAGRVIRQDPEADTFLDPDSQVNLVISLGEAQVAVPSMVGLDKDNAQRQLESDPYHFVVKLQEQDSDEPADQVLRTQPPANTQVDPGSDITVFYSDGPEEVPNVVGLPQGQAKNRIRAAGFEPRVIPDPNSTEPSGTVTDQSPAAGATANQGATVTILVSTFAEGPTETPSPTETPPSPTDSPTIVLPPDQRVSPPSRGRAGRRSSGRAGRRTPAR
jgi:serine/threonine-protein kinase